MVLDQMDQLSHVAIRGLMTIPPFSDNPEEARPYFSKMRQMQNSLVQERFIRVGMEELSMGMSHDFQVAIEEGATMVRIGTAIFGKRS